MLGQQEIGKTAAFSFRLAMIANLFRGPSDAVSRASLVLRACAS